MNLSEPQAESRVRSKRMIPALGTFVRLELSLEGAPFIYFSNLVFDEIRRVEKRFSFFDPESEISQLNRAPVGEWTSVGLEASRLLTLAQEIANDSEQAFCPGPRLEFRDGEVRKREAGMIDLGGIAKGYAIDCAVQMLFSARKDAGFERIFGSLNAGGDLFLFEPSPVSVSIEVGGAPSSGPSRKLKFYSFAHGALATSSTLKQEGRAAQYHARVSYRNEVTVYSERATIADALTKVALFSQNQNSFLKWNAKLVHEV